MIEEKKPLTLAEVREIVSEKSKGLKEENEENARLRNVNDLLKKVVKLKPAEAKKLSQELLGLNILKLKETPSSPN